MSFECEVSEITSEADRKLCDDVVEEDGVFTPYEPVKGESGTVAVKCNHPTILKKRGIGGKQLELGPNTCWAPGSLRYALRHQVGNSDPEKSLGHTVEGKYYNDRDPMNIHPFLRDNNGKEMRFRSQTETIDRLLERMQAKYEESTVMPKDTRTEKEKEKIVIMDAAKWHGNIKLCPPPCETVWAERPLGEFLLLYYSARDQKDIYMQIQERFQEANANVTMGDNESYASQNAAIPTEADLASYLFAHVVLQPERLTLARVVAERRRSEAEKRSREAISEEEKGEARSEAENQKNVLKKLNRILSTGGSRLTYEQTLELVTTGFRALDHSIFDDINTSYRPSELLADMARENNGDEVTRLLSENQFSVNMLSETLFSASDHGSEKVVEMLLQEDINVNHHRQYDDEGLTPLIVASANGHEKVVKMLLDAEGIDFNLADYYGSTPLYEACFFGHESVVKLLLAESGIYVNPVARALLSHQGADFYSPLHAASINGHENVVEMLLVNKTHIWPPIDVNQPNLNGETPLIRTISLASDSGVGSWDGDVKMVKVVKMLLDAKGIDVNQADNEGLTPLIIASSNGGDKMVKMLLDAEEINVNYQRDEDGFTPLIVASANGHEKVVKMLLDAEGINVNQADNEGLTPLIIVSANGGDKMVKMFLDAEEINVNQADNEGLTPLIVASANGHEKVVKILLDAEEINVNLADCHNSTPLYEASSRGRESVVKLLLAESGIVVNPLRNYGYDDGMSVWRGNPRSRRIRLFSARPR